MPLGERSSGSPAGLVERWSRYARRDLAEAGRRRRDGDGFGATLCTARARVRLAAAELLRGSTDPAQAAVVMHHTLCRLWVYDLPWIGFDEAAVRYTQARVWQDCARSIDPTLPEIQPRLDWA